MNLLDARCVWSFHQFWFDLLQMMLYIYIISRFSYPSMGCDVTYLSDFKCVNVSCIWWENEYVIEQICFRKQSFRTVFDRIWKFCIVPCSRSWVFIQLLTAKMYFPFVPFGSSILQLQTVCFTHFHRLNCKLPI